MTKYLLFIFGSFGYMIYQFIFSAIKVGQIVPTPDYFNLTAPILLSVAAGLFITKKTRAAGIFGLIGLTIASKDILSNWFILDELLESTNLYQIIVFFALTTSYLLYLAFITLKVLLNIENNDRFELIKIQPNYQAAKIIGIIPTVIIIAATIYWESLVK